MDSRGEREREREQVQEFKEFKRASSGVQRVQESKCYRVEKSDE
jgi:hypothetical protein